MAEDLFVDQIPLETRDQLTHAQHSLVCLHHIMMQLLETFEWVVLLPGSLILSMDAPYPWRFVFFPAVKEQPVHIFLNILSSAYIPEDEQRWKRSRSPSPDQIYRWVTIIFLTFFSSLRPLDHVIRRRVHGTGLSTPHKHHIKRQARHYILV